MHARTMGNCFGALPTAHPQTFRPSDPQTLLFQPQVAALTNIFETLQRTFGLLPPQVHP